MNSVNLIGRLTKDPALKYGAESQTAVCKFTIAIDRGKDKNGNDLGAYFPQCVCFGKTAENLERYCKKGRLIAVEGILTTGKYEGKNKETVYTTEVLANRIEFLEKGDAPTTNGFTPVTDDDIPF